MGIVAPCPFYAAWSLADPESNLSSGIPVTEDIRSAIDALGRHLSFMILEIVG